MAEKIRMVVDKKSLLLADQSLNITDEIVKKDLIKNLNQLN